MLILQGWNERLIMLWG